MADGVDSEGSRRVLVVEDDKNVRRVLRMVLDDAGFSVAEAGTGGEALDHLEEGGISGVVLDLGLPDSRSGEVLQWLHRHAEVPPWLVISAMDVTDAQRVDRSIRGRFIAKPFDPWLLAEQVKSLVAGFREQASPDPA